MRAATPWVAALLFARPGWIKQRPPRNLAVRVRPDQFAGPLWLLNSVGDRLMLVVGGMIAFIPMEALLQMLWYLLCQSSTAWPSKKSPSA
jgi:hypothetical protein